jgi:hypothetical protein
MGHIYDAANAATAYNRLKLEDQIAEDKAREMSEQMDFDIMKDLLTDAGWYTIELSTLTRMETLIDVNNWIYDNCKKSFITRGKIFIFKSKKEAEWFSLRWL